MRDHRSHAFCIVNCFTTTRLKAGWFSLLAPQRCILSDLKRILRVDVAVMVGSGRIVGHVVDVVQRAAGIRQLRNGVFPAVAHRRLRCAPRDAREHEGCLPVRKSERMAKQTAVETDLIQREPRILPRIAVGEKGVHRLRILHGRPPVHAGYGHALRRERGDDLLQLRLTEIHAHRTVAAELGDRTLIAARERKRLLRLLRLRLSGRAAGGNDQQQAQRQHRTPYAFHNSAPLRRIVFILTKEMQKCNCKSPAFCYTVRDGRGPEMRAR